MWIAGVRVSRGASSRADALNGWRARAVRRLVEPPAALESTRRAVREQDTDPGMTTVALTASAGSFRAHRLHDGFVSWDAFQRTVHYDAYYRKAAIADRMWIVFPVSRDAESYFVFDRKQARRRFSTADQELAAYALRGIKWFHRHLLLTHNLLHANVPLSHSQRRVLLQLMTDRTEKEIAVQLGFTPGTTHQYAMELYRSFGVKGRAGLMQLWLHG
jgi:DNA-binding CsgD family transcriptional regulator